MLRHDGGRRDALVSDDAFPHLVKTIPTPVGIVDQVNRKLADFRASFGRWPKAILLGPLDWWGFLEELAQAEIVDAYGPVFYRDIPVYMKQTPGVDIIVPPRIHGQFAMGLLKPRPPDGPTAA